MKTKPKITKEMTFSELLELAPKSARKLAERGLFCGGCPMAQFETIEQGALSHGLSKKQLDELIKELNK
jgi:hybrid cluster-associated redox disulfide protein